MTTPYRKKLIEVALPLMTISDAAGEEKAVPRRGHPQTLHLWWARRPLAACRAVLLASVLDDPSASPDRFPTKELQHAERLRLFALIDRAIQWENSSDPKVLAEVHAEVSSAVGHDLPRVADPFCGGGAIPLEASRLGFPVLARDLNPVAALITRGLIEAPRLYTLSEPSKKHLSRTADAAHPYRGLADVVLALAPNAPGGLGAIRTHFRPEQAGDLRDPR